MGDPIGEMEDEEFLSQVAAAEAEALSAKRRKINTTATATTSGEEKAAVEGVYTAALRGSRSLLFQQESSIGSNSRFKAGATGNNRGVFANPEFVGGGGSPAGGGGGSCFKCGKLGNWARDCGDSNCNSYGSDHNSVPEKACPCGLGTCLVLTANTDKNRGRKFYKCPAREENGGCGFFEWCDKNEGSNSSALRSQSHASNPSVPDVSCPCGAGSCLVLTAKTGKNIGQAFYRCPASQGSSCGFFKWCNDQTIVKSSPVLVNTSMVHRTNEMSNKSYGTRSGSSCFRCGKDGHWAKDCVLPSIQNPADRGGSYA